jgi:hypothetical protein
LREACRAKKESKKNRKTDIKSLKQAAGGGIITGHKPPG